jgi:hypothetical protein
MLLKMKWTLHHNIETEFTVEVFTTPDAAIDRACNLIDEGRECCWISFGSGSEPVQIAKGGLIYQLWLKSKPLLK